MTRKIYLTQQENKHLHLLWHVVLKTIMQQLTNPEGGSPDAAWVRLAHLFLKDNGIILKHRIRSKELLAQQLEALEELGGEEFPFEQKAPDLTLRPPKNPQN